MIWYGLQWFLNLCLSHLEATIPILVAIVVPIVQEFRNSANQRELKDQIVFLSRTVERQTTAIENLLPNLKKEAQQITDNVQTKWVNASEEAVRRAYSSSLALLATMTTKTNDPLSGIVTPQMREEARKEVAKALLSGPHTIRLTGVPSEEAFGRPTVSVVLNEVQAPQNQSVTATVKNPPWIKRAALAVARTARRILSARRSAKAKIAPRPATRVGSRYPAQSP